MTPGQPSRGAGKASTDTVVDIEDFCMLCGRAGFSFTRITNNILGGLYMLVGINSSSMNFFNFSAPFK